MALRKQIRPAGILHVQRGESTLPGLGMLSQWNLSGNTMKPTRTVTTTTTRVVATTTTSCKHHQKGHNFDDDAQKNPFGSPFTFGPIDTNPSTSSASAGPQSTAGGDKSGSPNGAHDFGLSLRRAAHDRPQAMGAPTLITSTTAQPATPARRAGILKAMAVGMTGTTVTATQTMTVTMAVTATTETATTSSLTSRARITSPARR